MESQCSLLYHEYIAAFQSLFATHTEQFQNLYIGLPIASAAGRLAEKGCKYLRASIW